jgi:gamma-glutamylcysteine synthetase
MLNVGVDRWVEVRQINVNPISIVGCLLEGLQ